ncbi:MAG: ABC transporter ATP-binding protein [Verrucomicrobia bacterium]|nr:ABC transporter ATP-binding protein [Verrucomicrobiota bacterium]MBU4289615.1 ABC transporter ATP-binding protein [Verrucomicrobiota bacterium]MBU4428156.1 ABC transporter ATP-binding protein [Verrucomicrobiota bacterium]MCG2680209.1 ABC transporter ATP-binding protein [Kiritimatiellia bacterium]
MSLAIEIKNLVVEYPSGRGVVQAVRGLNLSVPEGQVYGFLGPNGAGKTTTMHVLLGFIEAQSGEARIFNENVRHSIARQRIGYLPEHPDLYRFLTGRELLTMAGRLFLMSGRALKHRIEELLEMMGLAQAADRRIATYSRGMMQRIGLAQALIHDPELLILDEPTSGFDPLGRIEIRKMIAGLREHGKTVFFSSHELSEVERICDQVGILSGGRLVAEGVVSELVKGGESLENYFLRILL